MATDDHGGLWRRVEAGLRHGIWLGCFVVLAGHLGPRDYGVLVLAAGGATIVEAGLRAVVARLAGGGRRGSRRRSRPGRRCRPRSTSAPVRRRQCSTTRRWPT